MEQHISFCDTSTIISVDVGIVVWMLIVHWIYFHKVVNTILMKDAEIVKSAACHNYFTYVLYVMKSDFTKSSESPFYVTYCPFNSLSTWNIFIESFLSVDQMSVIPKRGYEAWFRWVLQSPNRCLSCGIYTPVSALSKRPEFRNTLASCAHPGQPVWALITIKLSSTTTWIIMNNRTAEKVWKFGVLHNMLRC